LAGSSAALGAAGAALLLSSLPFCERWTGAARKAAHSLARALPGGRALARPGRGAGAVPGGTAVPGGPLLLRVLVRAGAGLGPADGPPPGGLQARIAAAGSPAGIGPRELLAAKLAAAAVAGMGAATLVAAAGPGRLGVLTVLVAPVAGFLAPDLWLARRAAERARRMRAELPALLDLLRVCVESGGSLAESLRAVGSRTHGPLAAEWRSVGHQVALGVPLDAALARMAERAPLPELAALVAALQRARRHGVPLAHTLAAQARDARFALARHAREHAARAGPKIQLVVALLLVPSVLLLVAAALLAALLGGAAEPDGGAGAGLWLP
jgi:tight adherence protein C